MIPFIEGAIIAVSVQSLLYGVYLATLAYCLRWLVYADEGWKLRTKINWFMLTVTLVVFVFETTDLGISLRITIAEVVGEKLQVDQLLIGTITIENTMTLITDAVLIYRCWAISSKSSTVVCLPLILWLANTALLIIYTYWNTVGLDPNRFLWASARLPHVIEAFYACNIVINVYSTSSIVYCILRIAKDGGRGSSHLRVVIRILADSGVLYTLTTILLFTTTVVGTQPYLLGPLFGAINFTTTGITFNIVLIRVGHHRANHRDHLLSSTLDEKEGGGLSTLQFSEPIFSSGDASSNISDVEQGSHGRTKMGGVVCSWTN